jgi:hypothetical protein
LRIKLNCAGCAALDATLPAPLYGGIVFAIILPILDLPGSDIDDQLAELDRVARALEATTHFGFLSCCGTGGSSSPRRNPLRIDSVTLRSFSCIRRWV